MRSAGLVPLVLVAVAGCSSPQENDTVPPTATEKTSETSVTREEVPASTPSATPVQAEAIQTQPGPKNNSVALNKLSVTGDILTATLTFSGGSECCVHLPIDEVSVIDDATSQRISVLKDNQGKWMATPLEGGGRNVGPESYKTPSVVWFKFPAPPATSKTVSPTPPRSVEAARGGGGGVVE